MKKKLIFALCVLGWMLLLIGLLFGAVRDVGLDPGLYFELQMRENILDEAGISREDLLMLDVGLARYLGGKQDDLDYIIDVFGQRQSAFNERELIHMEDCRRLFAPIVNPWLNIGAAVVGVALVLSSEHRGKLSRRGHRYAVYLASALIFVPLGLLGVWAALDFHAAFNFFHRLLFTNDLWLLNPQTDLLIRICPAGMFAEMGLRIGLRAAIVLLGIPLILSVLLKLSERKRKQYENPVV